MPYLSVNWKISINNRLTCNVVAQQWTYATFLVSDKRVYCILLYTGGWDSVVGPGIKSQ
jgi:hypothetical protein